MLTPGTTGYETAGDGQPNCCRLRCYVTWELPGSPSVDAAAAAASAAPTATTEGGEVVMKTRQSQVINSTRRTDPISECLSVNVNETAENMVLLL